MTWPIFFKSWISYIDNMEDSMGNFVGMKGLEFIEYSSSDPGPMTKLFTQLGFSLIASHETNNIDYFNQNDIHFLLNSDPKSYAYKFQKLHGPSISSMGWRVENADTALEWAISKGAVEAIGDYPFKAIYGIGESIIYFVDNNTDLYSKLGFNDFSKKKEVPSKGFISIDHLTNNVEKGTMQDWASFYKDIFGFTEVRYFHIRGKQTGLTSYALQSPCKSFCIPINEGTEKKSQINEYLEEYKGPGVQHVALLTQDILKSLDGLKDTSIETLSIDDDYYTDILDKVPNITEELEDLKSRQILVDGDDEGYLLQIFTKNVIGPIFFEILQRKNHYSFGEGNFGALFRSIEKDQQQRGYLD